MFGEDVFNQNNTDKAIQTITIVIGQYTLNLKRNLWKFQKKKKKKKKKNMRKGMKVQVQSTLTIQVCYPDNILLTLNVKLFQSEYKRTTKQLAIR
jgi:hypothetical protein